jgi:glycosyltransferase involved in cell wall biosynthesis
LQARWQGRQQPRLPFGANAVIFTHTNAQHPMQKTPISVVIVAKNEARIIGTTIKAAAQVARETLVADTGSTDDTVAIAESLGCTIHRLDWQGFGNTKNSAIDLAAHDWVLCIDADEVIDDEAIAAINALDFSNQNAVFALKFTNYIGNKAQHFGALRPFKKNRLFNRKSTRWNDSPIHEQLILPQNVARQVLSGSIQHYSYAHLAHYVGKTVSYAGLMAKKYAAEGRRPSFFKLYAYPSLEFFTNYVVRLGFLDGRLGFATAKVAALYVFLKYHFLQELMAEP